MSEQSKPTIKPPGICLPARPPRTNVVSDEKAKANQQNAQKSTGPTSEGGRAASSRNSLKHGLLAKSVVVDSPTGAESRSDFDALLADLCNELQPVGLIEQTLVERIATCYWRLNRAQRYETGAVRETLEVPDTRADHLDKLALELPKAEKAMAIMDRLADLFAKQSKTFIPSQDKEVADLIDQLPLDPIAEALTNVYGLNAKTKADDLRARLPRMRLEQQLKVKELRQELKHQEGQSDLRRSRRNLVGSLPDGLSLLKVIRYETMLDRQIHRALNELRRLRDARM